MNKAPPRAGQPIQQASAPLLRTEGQRMLLHVSGSLLAIAKAVDVKSPQTILRWRNGVVLPRTEERARMQVALGIPIEAWARRPAGEKHEHAEESAGELPTSSMAHTEELLHVIRMERNTPHLLPSEKTKLIAAEAGLLKLRADFEARAELSEDRYVREHPGWMRIRNELARVLAAFPEAARAVAEALERLNA